MRFTQSDPVTIVGSYRSGYRRLPTQRLNSLEKNSDEGHGAVHDVKGASRDAGAARVSRGAHHIVKVTRSQVRTVWRHHGSQGVRRHRVTFQLADGEAGELSVVGRLKADCTSCLTRGAVCDIFTILAHSNWHRVCVLVEKRVTWQASKDPVRQAALSFSL